MIEDQTKQNDTGPYTEKEVIAILNSDVTCWDIEPYNMYGFNCIGCFYELSTGFYFE
ncbi:hypothetical protein PVK69_07445 [Aliivibrio sp. S4MY2]|uniref:hypothetical protein n=1 Tax=unclassified Aliivibrio TaxID=2645654 RepID=UPI002378A2F6|nr:MULTISPECIES: hypothetical protein [unclassified Aliivibrio]MDD9164029.1 hypothetical protein [Aliivibrio sp. S4MY2]MDD9202304.1 hypothetical protein [Aliivibrio sp. S4MY1]